jgi:hypothetical protein
MDHQPQDPDLPTSSAESKGMDRRTLLRAGAAATPIIATLYSRPVAAAGMSCTVASSFVSVATFASRNPGATTMQCTTLSASDWHLNAKALSGVAPADRPAWANLTVSGYLGRASSAFSGLDSMTNESYQIWQVMGLGAQVATTGELGVVQHILAMCLSIDYGGAAVAAGGGVNTPYLKQVWQNYKSNGRYKLPASNLDWSEGELIGWLRMLQYPIAPVVA